MGFDMAVYALIRIKEGATVSQDFCTYHWPPSEGSERIQRKAKVADDTVFIAQKHVSYGRVRWECRARGAGIRGDYGNGAISVPSEQTIMLTPMLGFEPDIDDVQKVLHTHGYCR